MNDEYIRRVEAEEAIEEYCCRRCKDYSEVEGGCISHAQHCEHLSGEEILKPVKSADVQPVNQWISVKDRLPEDNRPVLCFVIDTTGEGITYVIGSCEHSEFWFLKIGDNKRFSFPYMQIKVTHWIPLPELPKEGDTE